MLPSALLSLSTGPEFYPALNCDVCLFTVYYYGLSLEFLSVQGSVHLQWSL